MARVSNNPHIVQALRSLMLEQFTSQDGYYALPYLRISKAPTIQLYHDTGHFEDLINLFIITIPCESKSLSSSLSADNLSSYGGIEYPLSSSGRDCHAQGIHSKPTI